MYPAFASHAGRSALADLGILCDPCHQLMPRLLELFLHSPIGRMLAVLDLYPVLRSAGAIRAIGPRGAAIAVLTIEHQNIEGVKLDFLVPPARCRALKSAMPSTPSTTASPLMTNCRCRFLRAASTIQE